MRTLIELSKEGERTVFHQTDKAQKAWTHPDDKSYLCETCVALGRVKK